MQDPAKNDAIISTTALSETVPSDFYNRISDILQQARGRAYSAVNYSMVLAYWEIGKTLWKSRAARIAQNTVRRLLRSFRSV